MRPPKTHQLSIKNMVCDRCIRVVRDELSALGHDVRRVTLGDAEIGAVPTPQQTEAIRAMLERNGFELIEDRNARIIEAVKTAVIRLVHHDHSSSPMKLKYSDLLAREVGKDYHALSVLFSSVENITIEQYIIRQRIERVKELIRYDDRSLSEIAYMMRYSSVQHLSSQFKAVTGFTPTAFKSLAPTHRARQRKPLDKVK